MKKTIIIGGGASGLTAAINAKEDDNEVIILEKNSDVGKKILVTGNGKCNYFNEDQDINHYHSNNKELVKNFITSDRIKKVLPFFESIGIIPFIKDGYYYPNSNQAISLRNALEIECINKGVKIIRDANVIGIKKENKFIIETNNETYESDILVIATGSKASPKTGSDGSGYEFALNLGHKIIKPLPGLVQLVCNSKLKEASGVRIKTKLSLIEDGNLIKDEVGELQITDYGISGIVAMQLSSYIARGLDENKKEEILINFLPGISDIKTFIENLNNNLNNRTISEILDGLLNYKLVNVILKDSNINNNEFYNNLNNEKRDKLIENLSAYKINIDNTKDFDSAQICTGGIPLDELTNEFESKKIKDLYFTGEIIDINGDCGGYNLTFAWISGITVGNTIKKKP